LSTKYDNMDYRIEKVLIKPERDMIKRRSFRIYIIITAFIIGSFGAGTYYFKDNFVKIFDIDKKKVTDTARLITDISKLIVLPEGEEPTIATVSDPALLKSQPFFINAKQGDKVIIYAKAQKAILYDPIAGKIINVAPINLGDQKATKVTH